MSICKAFVRLARIFWITREAVEGARRKKKIHLLSAALRALSNDFWESAGGPIGLFDWEDLAASVTSLSVSEQFEEAIVVICKACPEPGAKAKFSPWYDCPLIRAQSREAAEYIINELCELGFVKKGDDGHVVIPPIPTWKAFERLEELESSGRNSNRAFVAMAFSPAYDEVWLKAIQPGILDAGYNPIRVDKEQHSDRIDDFIISQIRRCRFLVADFTGQRNGVYFEAGFALGLGRKVIWMCNESEKDKLHFDTRQFNHIMYTDLEQARKQLTDRIATASLR